MITAEVQIHGYRMGHQLLASSVVLSKDDQATVDRLSDVAGPLRPREHFSPYLSAYPLPSGTFYVVARTWQDLTVDRAGCVRTKSVLIDAHTWSHKAPITTILHLLDSVGLPDVTEAIRIEMEQLLDEQLPTVPSFGASDLLEALFLEDSKPVVVFDAPDPEVIATRLLYALWPDIRRRFSLSTFALSPRKIGGRDLDLVFAPSDAKSKFTDWPGRRVDGRTTQNDRHRWTGTIVRRVFGDPFPRLLSNTEIDLLGNREADSAATLRLALLWDELLGKLDKMPTAALGLLDIANSGMISNSRALKTLEPRLVEAMRQIDSTLTASDAWAFVGAIARKMHGYDMPDGRIAVGQLAASLAKREPEGAVSLLRQPDPKGAVNDLISSIAIGLGSGEAPHVEQVLATAPADIIARLVSQGGPLTSRIAANDTLIEKMVVVFMEVERDLADRAGIKLLPFLVEDRQLSAALPIFERLGPEQLATELDWLGSSNNFKAQLLCGALINRARQVGGLLAAREVLISSDESEGRDALLAQTIQPVIDDVSWILTEKRLPERKATALLVDMLNASEDRQLSALLSDQLIGERLVARLLQVDIQLLIRALLQDLLPVDLSVHVILKVMPKIDDIRKVEIAGRVLGRYLRSGFDEDDTSILHMLFGILGPQLNAGWAAKAGLGRGVEARVASRNMIAFDKAPPAARERIVRAVDEIARALHERQALDLTGAANEACASIMFAAEKTSRPALADAARWLLPSLFRAHHKPISLMIVALFPVLYRDLAKNDDGYDFLSIVPFLVLDRRKIARTELVEAFMSSSWKEGDLALTACRCDDVAKILKQVKWSYRGEEYLDRIGHDLNRLDDASRRLVKRTIDEIR